MKHIFLTGEIQIGKSTVIKKTLSLLKVKYGGFCTYFGPDRTNPDRCLYINDASQPQYYGDHNVIARFRNGFSPEAYAERFDILGADYIRMAREKAELIIMDECGSLERDAVLFQREIFDTLEGDIPVLGVIKLFSAGWVEKVRHHPNVKIITVEKNSRDMLPALLAGMLRQL